MQERRRTMSWLASAAVLGVGSLWPLDSAQPEASTKGGELALKLVGDVHGESPWTFAPGEHFKVYVTCPDSFSRVLGVLVFQGQARFEPMARGALRCGENLAAWPGAFALDGAEVADVCVVWGDALHNARSAENVGSEGGCQRLLPRP